MELVTHYRDAAEMCAGGGWAWIGTLIEQVGLPLEVLAIGNGRLYEVDAFDYEEGQARPMTRRRQWWREAIGQPPAPPGAIPSAVVAVYPDGSWHVLADDQDVR